MLHHGHPARARAGGPPSCAGLRYVVIDECHTYRGVFGSHVAHVLRRLRRQRARYGTPDAGLRAGLGHLRRSRRRRPAGSPALPVAAVTEDTSPRAGYLRALGTAAAARPRRARRTRGAGTASALRETADLLADPSPRAYAPSPSSGPGGAPRWSPRSPAGRSTRRCPGWATAGGRLPGRLPAEERRALERALLHGDLLGLASTNALELGVDLVGLDAVLICGYPGTRASLWQQAGRAGRPGRRGAGGAGGPGRPARHLPGAPSRGAVRPPGRGAPCSTRPTRTCSGPQLCCAAAEAPLTPADLELFGERWREAVASLVAAGALRPRPTGWYWRHRDRPEVDLRGAGGAPIAVVEASPAGCSARSTPAPSHFLVHSGAVYLHQGVSYVVDELDLADACALGARRGAGLVDARPRRHRVSVVGAARTWTPDRSALFLGEVDVTSQVVSYQRRRIAARRGAWTPGRWTCRRESCVPWRSGSRSRPPRWPPPVVAEADVPGALHAAEHAAIGLLPLIATCDRWDIGGLSTAAHPDTEAPTVFVYDGHPGGAGFAERAYGAAPGWLGATRDAIARAAARPAARPACSRRSAATATTRWPRPVPSRCWNVVLAALARTAPDPCGPAGPDSRSSAGPGLGPDPDLGPRREDGGS